MRTSTGLQPLALPQTDNPSTVSINNEIKLHLTLILKPLGRLITLSKVIPPQTKIKREAKEAPLLCRSITLERISQREDQRKGAAKLTKMGRIS